VFRETGNPSLTYPGARLRSDDARTGVSSSWYSWTVAVTWRGVVSAVDGPAHRWALSRANCICGICEGSRAEQRAWLEGAISASGCGDRT
jgi:hypothetical protein